jgi:hypothetical protein
MGVRLRARGCSYSRRYGCDLWREASYERADRLDDVLEHGRSAQHASCTERAPRQLVVAYELVEPRQVFVESEHVRDCPHQRSIGTAFDPNVPFALGEAHRSRTAGNCERRRERSSLEIELVRRQLGDPVRDDRADEVDRLPAGSSQQQLRDGHVVSLPKGGPRAKLRAQR